jgi:hypothetical protein
MIIETITTKNVKEKDNIMTKIKDQTTRKINQNVKGGKESQEKNPQKLLLRLRYQTCQKRKRC